MRFLLDAVNGHMDVVYLLYGLAFVLLGVSILQLPKDGSPHRFARILWLLAAFGIVHGVKEWFDLWALHKGQGAVTYAVSQAVLVVSFCFLLEFGRRLVRASRDDPTARPWLARVSGPWLYAPLSLGVTLALSMDPVSGLSIGARYFIGLPAALLTALGFIELARRQRRRVDPAYPAVRFKLTAAGFAAYAVFGGLIVEHGSIPPANVVNQAAFLALVNLPVQAFRAACAVWILVCVSGILRVLRDEVNRRLHRSLDEAMSSLVEVGRLSARNQLLLEAAGQGVCGMNRRGIVTFVNAMAASTLGRCPEELIGRRAHEVLHHTKPDGSPFPHGECPVEATLRDGSVHQSENDLFWTKTGTAVPVDYISTPVRDQGRVVGAVVSFRDVTERQQVRRQLLEAALVLEHMPEGVMITDARGRIQFVNPAFLTNTGYLREEVVGRTPTMLRSSHHPADFYRKIWSALADSGRWQGEVWVRRKDGEIYPEWLGVNSLQDGRGKITNYVVLYSDINTHRDVQRRLNHLAYYDALTDLPNRQLFKDRLEQTMAHARREQKRVALMFLDLDRFKHINDTLGHSVGDRLLQAVAKRLDSAMRESDTIARIGGDEFTAILPDLARPIDAAATARKMLDLFATPISLDGREFHVTASIGISVYPDDGDDQESLMRKADTAMYRAKEIGRNRYEFYRANLGARFQERLLLEHDLRRALDRDELSLVYQPQIEIASGRLAGAETLARWQHPRLGQIPPSTFIAIAEETGLIGRIGEWSLETACRDARRWAPRLEDSFRIAVNVSGHQLRDPDFTSIVAEVLRQTGLPATRLALELTESVLMDEFTDHDATLGHLMRMGVQIALDDFGTGYSSLSYVKRFSIDKLKIDKSFVQDLPRDSNDCALASMIIAMAHASNIRVVAEGVERQEQLDYLRSQGCDEVQGFLVGRPLSAGGFARFLHQQRVAPNGSASRRPQRVAGPWADRAAIRRTAE